MQTPLDSFDAATAHRPLLLLALGLAIPAFYLVLAGSSPLYRALGSSLYAAMAVSLIVDLLRRHRQRVPALPEPIGAIRGVGVIDLVLLCVALLSIWPSTPPWSGWEWLLRLGACAIVFSRLVLLLVNWVEQRRLLQLLAGAGALMAMSGAGFYWLEPNVHSYADGLWLAFITAATVGYGDLVPSTAASRILATFIVLLGYAVFSVATASIAALLVGEEEKRFERELHADIRHLRHEVAQLRAELHQHPSAPATTPVPTPVPTPAHTPAPTPAPIQVPPP